jgi:hypothetical protein
MNYPDLKDGASNLIGIMLGTRRESYSPSTGAVPLIPNGIVDLGHTCHQRNYYNCKLMKKSKAHLYSPPEGRGFTCNLLKCKQCGVAASFGRTGNKLIPPFYLFLWTKKLLTLRTNRTQNIRHKKPA